MSNFKTLLIPKFSKLDFSLRFSFYGSKRFTMKIFWTIFSAAIVLGSVYFLTMPSEYQKNITQEEQKIINNSNFDLIALKAESEKIYADFLKKQELASVSDSDLQILENAILNLEKYIRLEKSYDRDLTLKLGQMRSTLQNIKGKSDSEKVASLMIQADNAFTAQESIKAIELYKEALALQTKINTIYRDSEYYDVRITAKAEQMLKLVSAAPIATEIENLYAQYKKETSQAHWIEAQKLIERCIELQIQINKEFSNTSYVDFKKVHDFEIELNSLKAAPLKNEVAQALSAGDEFEKQKQYQNAAEKFAYAEEKQKEINTIFANSRYASDDKLNEIISKKESVLGRKEYESIESDFDKLNDMIRQNVPYENIVKLADSLLSYCENFRKMYPHSSILNEEKVLSLRYISFLGQNINQINDIVKNNLIQLEKDSKIYMYKSEVDQKLYKLVMNENRSRNVGDNLPVETISLENARDFCRRLSWAIAKKVDLPTKEQFLKAVGSLKYVDLNAISWNASNSEMKSHEIAKKEANSKGFFDLLGNVAEFVKDGDSFAIMGGSSQSWTDVISTIPFTPVEKNLRGDRMIGFRFVIWQD